MTKNNLLLTSGVLFTLSAFADLTTGLIAHYTFDGNTVDVSGNDHHGSPLETTYAEDRLYNPNRAVLLNGTTAYISIGKGISPTAFTLSAWIWIDRLSSSPLVIISKLHNCSPDLYKNFEFRVNPDGRLLAHIPNGYPFWPSITSTRILSLRTWHHVAVTYDGAIGSLFVNGTKEPNQFQGNYAQSDVEVAIGARPDGGSPAGKCMFFSGLIDDLRIYNRALSPVEIGELFGDMPTPSAPSVISQPTSFSTNAGTTASFSVSVSGSRPLTYQWLKNGSAITGATNSMLSIGSVSPCDNGTYSVKILNAYGAVKSADACLAVLGILDQETFLTAYPEVPQKEPHQDNLVIVTHGFHEKWLSSDPDPNYYPWVTNMTYTIEQWLSSQGKTDWRVEPYFWIEKAFTVDPDEAKANAEPLGDKLGARIGSQHWAHVHLIAHSAGCALIQAAAEKIKEVSEETIVHTTFLDPFVGLKNTSGRKEYGALADWADNYYAEDMTGSWTSRLLLNAHNVNVTRADPDKTEATCYSSSDGEEPSSYRAALSSHGWPHDFYTSTIINGMPDSEGYGFPLSKEGGGWDKRVYYQSNNVPPKELGSSSACLPPVKLIPTYTAPSFNLNQVPYAQSEAGTTIFQTGFDLFRFMPDLTPNKLSAGMFSQTASASWISMAIPVTNNANYLSFSAGFSSPTNSEGLLTVYWNTNSIGSIEERAAKAGIQTYRFSLPDTYTEGLYSLTFRLDSFNSVTSQVSVTDVALGFAGSTEPFTLNVGADTAAGITMTLTGDSGYNYLVENSTNLVDWSLFAILANTNGTVRFYDPDAVNYNKRFYRAVRP